MKKIVLLILLTPLLFFLKSCASKKEIVTISNITSEEKKTFSQIKGDTITIANEKTEYEITIIEPGFNAWLLSVAKPEGYYEQSFIQSRNQIFVREWNSRVLRPSRFDPSLYEMQVDYQMSIDYGYEVNYKLYNYFIYFQRKYKQKLGPFTPRI